MEEKKIMVIDDQEMIVELIKSVMVDKPQYRIISYSDSLAAVDALTNGAVVPDILLLDLLMPKIDGLKVLTLIRENEKFKTLPIIIITSKGQKLNVDRAMKAGATLFMTKPFVPNELVKKIESLLAPTGA